MRVVHTTAFPTQVSASSGLIWSPDDKLAIITHKGTLIYTLIPNPTCSEQQLNFEQVLIDSTADVNEFIEAHHSFESCERLANYDHPIPEAGKPTLRVVDSADWSPMGAVRPGESALVTLTEDHWLRIYRRKEENHNWEVEFDVSEELNVALNPRPVHVPQDTPMQEAAKIIKEWSYSQSINGFVWTDIVETKSLLITSQKDQKLAIFEIDSENQTLKFVSFYKLPLIMTSVVKLYKVDGEIFLLFLGTADGRVLTLKLNYNGRKKPVIQNLGFGIWEDNDHARVGTINVIRDNFLDNQHLTLAFSKAHFLLVIDVNFAGDGNAKQTSRYAKSVAANISEIQSLPDGSHLVIRQKGVPFQLMIPEDIKKCTLSDFPLPGLDVNNFKCHGMRRSNGGAIYAYLQNIATYHDHLILRNPSKLTFFTPYTLDGLSKFLLEAENSDIGMYKDSLEVYRCLSHSDEEIHLDHVLENVTGNLMKQKLYIWMIQLFKTLSDEDSRTQLEEVHDSLCLQQLTIYALGVVEQLKETNPEFCGSYIRFLLKNETDPKALEGLENVKSFAECEESWKCKFCNSGVKEDNYDRVECLKGHVWPRCVKTFKVCDSSILYSCSWCQAMASPEFLKHLDKVCTLCGGPLTSAV